MQNESKPKEWIDYKDLRRWMLVPGVVYGCFENGHKKCHPHFKKVAIYTFEDIIYELVFPEKTQC